MIVTNFTRKSCNRFPSHLFNWRSLRWALFFVTYEGSDTLILQKGDHMSRDIIYILSMFLFFRKLIGGNWYKVKHKYFHETYWINRKPLSSEIVLHIESW